MPAWLKDKRTILLTTLVVVWTLCVFDWLGSGMLRFLHVERFAAWIHSAVFGLAAAVTLAIWSKAWVDYKARRVRFFLISSIAFFPWWQIDVFLADLFGWDTVRVSMAQLGTGITYIGGLCWVVWGLEQGARQFRIRRLAGEDTGDFVPATFNPLDPDARYYGRQKKLNQSLSAFCSYSVLFILAFYFMSNVGGCREVFDLPAGGGEQKPIAQQIKIQKIIRKKYVFNPFSSIKHLVPPIDEVIKLQLEEITKHAYTVGYGRGQGAGYGGKRNVKIRFIRLEYQGGDWNQGYGPGDDENLLIELPSFMPGHKFEKKTESRTVAQLKRFDRIAAPPMVYMTGQKGITLSTSEIRILREYLLEKHGMIFADNGGSRDWHNQFFAMMTKALPEIRPVPISLDDPIHRIPVPLNFFPYVAPHGGDRPMGWKVDGRWVCYYHPGDIGDAWANGHAGIDAEIWQACYALGANIINYAYNEHAMWREAQREKQ